MKLQAAMLTGILALGPATAFAAPAEPPSYLLPEGRAAFQAYLASPVGKAFAAEPGGGFAWRSGEDSTAVARDKALQACQQANPGKSCAIVSVDGESAR